VEQAQGKGGLGATDDAEVIFEKSQTVYEASGNLHQSWQEGAGEKKD